MAGSPIEFVFFDLDDCLYKNGWATMDKVTAKVGEYCTKLGVSPERAFQLYKTHGTTVCGLVREGYLEEGSVPEFLRYMHDVPLEDVLPAPGLREVIEAIPHKRFVFTASIPEHAERCLRRLGIEDLFVRVVSASSAEMIQRVGYVSKHDERCFGAAMDLAGVPRELASRCVLLDDSQTNLRTAKALGWRTVLVGREARDGSRIRCPHADASVNSLPALREEAPELPGLFARPDTTAPQTEQGEKRPWGKEPSAADVCGAGYSSETESTSAGEDMEECGPAAQAKRRRLGADDSNDRLTTALGSSASASRSLRHCISNSTDGSYEGLSQEEPMAA